MAGKLRILHLEDEPRDTELMIAALRAAGIDRMEAHALWRKERPGIPFIFLWGSTGAKAYVTKPLDVSKMLALIDERLGH